MGWPTTSFEIGQLQEVVINTLKGKRAKIVTFAQATTNDGQSLLAVNDYSLARKHISARYLLNWNGEQSFIFWNNYIHRTWVNGVVSIYLAGAQAIMGVSTHPLAKGFGWESKLQFSVRSRFWQNDRNQMGIWHD